MRRSKRCTATLTGSGRRGNGGEAPARDDTKVPPIMLVSYVPVRGPHDALPPSIPRSAPKRSGNAGWGLANDPFGPPMTKRR